MNHTPGPWTSRPAHSFSYYIDAPSKRELYFLGASTALPSAEHKANAMLISAAPDLLAACEHVISNYGHNAQDDCGCEDCEYLRPVTQAIAKAKGDAQ
jgi:hypothetical protein